MTATVNQLTVTATMAYSAEARWGSMVLILALLLIGLLVQHEMVRAHAGHHTAAWVHALRIVILPLALAYGFLLVTHLMGLLYLF